MGVQVLGSTASKDGPALDGDGDGDGDGGVGAMAQ
jgi:hypothetical protein